MSALRIIEASDQQGVEALRDTLRAGGLVADRDAGWDVPAIVHQTLEDVIRRGDAALIEKTAELEHAELTAGELRIGADEIRAEHAKAAPEFLELVRRVVANIREYQEHIRHRDCEPLSRGGRRLGVRYTPIDRVGIYVPGGRAVYPSTVLMTVVPALVAGVPEIALLSPPTGGNISPMVLALAGELGLDEVYRCSGTAGICALAVGTESVRAVNKICGPGNAFIAEAKRQVLGRVGIDSIAGPSEVLIVADDEADADWLAADLLAQAEHNPGSAVLVTPSRVLAEAVAAAVDVQSGDLDRGAEARECLAAYGGAIVTDSLESACDIASDFATEHLQIITSDDDACLARIRNAGAVFVGPHTPVPTGDYYAGPSHVLPTGGTAKFFGPLSVNDFLKASSVIRYDAASLNADGPDIADFARLEGLTAHARAVERRIRK